MRLWPRHWHPETWVCSLHGHATPAADAATLTPADVGLGAVLADGRRLARCLRCDTWIEHPVPVGDQVRYATLPPLAALAKPRRGKVLHEAIVMKLIAINKATHAFAFTVLAVTLLVLETNLDRLHSFADRVQRSLDGTLADSGQGASHTWLGRQLANLLNLKVDTLKVLLVLALVYAVVEWTEAIGLWLERRWAEYLTVLATAGFLPLEIRELLHRVTALRVLALVVNVALLVWLVRNKRLFGVRGGLKAMHDDLDWDAVIAKPTPAGRHERY
jgi:uncharacterized membrane protein (DUF2068 family)